MGIINLMTDRDDFSSLTNDRCVAAIPFASNYRFIDFTLNNFIHSEINEIAIFTHTKSRSLLNYLGSGLDWGLNTYKKGLYILPSSPDIIQQSDIDYFIKNWDCIEKSNAEHLLISGSTFITNTSYQSMMEQHISNNNDMTFLVTNDTQKRSNSISVMSDVNGKVKEISYHHNGALFTGVYMIKKECLIQLIKKAKLTSCKQLINVIITEFKQYNTESYVYVDEYYYMDSSTQYYHCSMLLLNRNNYQNLMRKCKIIKSKESHYSPTKYGKNATVCNSLVGSGCQLYGSIDHSILFQGITIEKGATIKNSIIFDHCLIKSGAYIENAIVDKHSFISSKETIIGSIKSPILIAKQTNKLSSVM